jgi:GT2 family glycosyltransferase
LATASVRLADDPDRLNSAGNEIHFLGVSWSGWFGQLASAHPERRSVAAASGAALVCRREVWTALGGFCDELFAYCEDADLSLRCWQRGWTVAYVPTAVVVHRYEFSRNPLKYRLLERNRAVMAWSCLSTRHLALTSPLLVALELGTLVYAARHGWLREKLAAYRWLWLHAGWLRRRRVEVQGARTVPHRELAHLFSPQLAPANLELPSFVRPLDRVMAAYWRLVRRAI